MFHFKIKYKDIVYIKVSNKDILNINLIKCIVNGKIKNADAYIISNIDNHIILNQLKDKYGYPIRQIPLEWGNFSGNVDEFIIKLSDIITKE